MATETLVPLEWGKQLHDTISGSRFEVIEDTGHGLLLTSEEARAKVKTFLAGSSTN